MRAKKIMLKVLSTVTAATMMLGNIPASYVYAAEDNNTSVVEKVQDAYVPSDEEKKERFIAFKKQSYSKTIGGVTITVEGSMPTDSELKIVELKTDDVEDIIYDETLKSVEKAYDITILNEGREYEPYEYDREMTVTFSDIDRLGDGAYSVVHICDDGTVEEMGSTDTILNSTDIEFKTDSFSAYTLVKATASLSVEEGTDQGIALVDEAYGVTTSKIYHMTLTRADNGEHLEAFCLDHGKSASSGTSFTQVGEYSNKEIKRILTVFYADSAAPLPSGNYNGSGYSFTYTEAQALIWAAQKSITGTDNYKTVLASLGTSDTNQEAITDEIESLQSVSNLSSFYVWDPRDSEENSLSGTYQRFITMLGKAVYESTSLSSTSDIWQVGDNAYAYFEETNTSTHNGTLHIIGYGDCWDCVVTSGNKYYVYTDTTGSYAPTGNMQPYRSKKTATDAYSTGSYSATSCWWDYITAIDIEDGITHIGNYMFADSGTRAKVESVVIPSSVKSIGDHAFDYTHTVSSYTFPEGLESIGKFAFRYNTVYAGSVVLPSSVTTVGEWAFFQWEKLTSFTWSENAEVIPNGALQHCESLTNVVIPYGVTYIEGGSMSRNSALTTITIPDSVTTIRQYAFKVEDSFDVDTDSDGTNDMLATTVNATDPFGFTYIDTNDGSTRRYIWGTDKRYIPGETDFYTVKFYSNGGSGTMEDQEIPTSTATALRENTFERDGYSFMGWATSASGSVVYEDEELVTNIGNSGDTIRLYAKWERGYKVTYRATAATGGTIPSDTTLYESGDTVSILEGEPERTGYDFIGWKITRPSGDDTIYSYNDPDANSFTITKQTTLTAQWVKSLSVKYYKNGATSGSVPTDDTEYSSGQSVTVLGNTGGLEKTGYDFTGWNTKADRSGTHYDAEDTFSIIAKTRLYAEWKKAVKVTYASQSGTENVPTDDTVYHVGDTVTVLGRGTMKLAGKTFAGWKNAVGGAIYSEGDTFDIERNTTLTAQWKGRTLTSRVQDGIIAEYDDPSAPQGSTVEPDKTHVYPTYHEEYDNGETADKVPDRTSEIPASDYTLDHNTVDDDGDNTFIATQTSTGFTDDFIITTAAIVSRVLTDITCTYTGSELYIGQAVSKDDITVYAIYTVTYDNGTVITETVGPLASADFRITNDSDPLDDGAVATEAPETIIYVTYDENKDHRVAGYINITRPLGIPTRGIAETGRTATGLRATYPREAEPVGTVLDKDSFTTIITYHVTYEDGSEKDIDVTLTSDDFTLNITTIRDVKVYNVKVTETVTGNSLSCVVTIKGYESSTGFIPVAIEAEEHYFTLTITDILQDTEKGTDESYTREQRTVLKGSVVTASPKEITGYTAATQEQTVTVTEDTELKFYYTKNAETPSDDVLTTYKVTVKDIYYNEKNVMEKSDVRDDYQVVKGTEVTAKALSPIDYIVFGDKVKTVTVTEDIEITFTYKKNASDSDTDNNNDDDEDDDDDKDDDDDTGNSSVTPTPAPTDPDPQPSPDPAPAPSEQEENNDNKDKDKTKKKSTSDNGRDDNEGHSDDGSQSEDENSQYIVNDYDNRETDNTANMRDGDVVIVSPSDDTDDNNRPRRNAVRNVVAALIAGAIAVGLAATGALNYLWMMILMFFTKGKKRKWHGVLTTEKNSFIELRVPEGTSGKTVQDYIDEIKVPASVMDLLMDTKEYTLLPVNTRMSISYTDPVHGFVETDLKADESELYKMLETLKGSGEIDIRIYNKPAKINIDLTYKI